MKIDTINYGLSAFEFRKRALIRYKSFWDFSYFTSVMEFVISGTEPPDTSRRIIFDVDGELYRFVNNILDKYIWRGELDDILEYGNTVGELLELPNLNFFIGKKVKPIIALDAPNNAAVYPSIFIKVKATSYNDIYTKNAYSPIFDLDSNSRIVQVSESKTTAGNATATTYARIKKLSGEWDDWKFLAEIEGEIATQIQFRTHYVLTTLDGTDYAKIHNISVKFADADKLAADSQNYFSQTQNYDSDLHTCYLLVKHSPLYESSIKAFVQMKPPTSKAENINLGNTTGLEQTFLTPQKYFAQDTLHLELDGKPTTNFDFDTSNSSINLTADVGQAVTSSFEFSPAETWHEMSLDYSNESETRFIFRTKDSNLREVAVRFEVTKNSGAESLNLGEGTGKLQTFALEHIPEKITCNSAFKNENQVVQVVQVFGKNITLDYNWRGSLPKILGYTAGWQI